MGLRLRGAWSLSVFTLVKLSLTEWVGRVVGREWKEDTCKSRGLKIKINDYTETTKV